MAYTLAKQNGIIYINKGIANNVGTITPVLITKALYYL